MRLLLKLMRIVYALTPLKGRGPENLTLALAEETTWHFSTHAAGGGFGKIQAESILPYFISKVLKPPVTTSYELGPEAATGATTGATTFGFNAATRSAKFPVNA